jgi:hypothetical protein
MSLGRSARPTQLRGVQQPRSFWLPPSASSCGPEALEVCELGGIKFDPWQEIGFTGLLGERTDGTWSALEAGVEVSRQNGKGEIMLGRQVTGLFLLEEKVQIYSAHRFDTSLEAFRRLRQVVEETPDFDREVLRISKSHGEEGIELRRDRRIGFRTRAGGGGRGLTGDVLYLDEAMVLALALMGDLMPLLSARPNPQIIYAGSAVNQLQHEHGQVFARIRQRGLAGGDPRLAWMSWGEPPGEDGEELSPDETEHLADDPEAWARANPGLGIRVTRDFIEAERKTLDPRNFAVERLGVGDWPDPDEAPDEELFDREEWAAIADRSYGEESIDGPPVLVWDVSPDRSWASIGGAGFRPDGLMFIELIDRRRGTGWVAQRLADIALKQGVTEGNVLVDGRSEAASLIPAVEEALRFEVTVVSTSEYAEACGTFFDAVPQQTMRHGGQPELDEAVFGAAERPLGEASAWGRKKSSTDITALVACTIARWGAARGEEESIWERRAREAEEGDGEPSEDFSEEAALL